MRPSTRPIFPSSFRTGTTAITESPRYMGSPGRRLRIPAPPTAAARRATRHPGEPLGLVELRVARDRALELAERAAVVAGVGERLAELEVRPAVLGVLGEIPAEGLAAVGRLLERDVHRAERPVDAPVEAAEGTAPLERVPRRVELADGLVHAPEEQLPLGVVGLVVGHAAIAGDHDVGGLRDGPRHGLYLGELLGGRRPPRR